MKTDYGKCLHHKHKQWLREVIVVDIKSDAMKAGVRIYISFSTLCSVFIGFKRLVNICLVLLCFKA